MQVAKNIKENELIELHCKNLSASIFYEVSIGDKSIFGKNSTDRRIDIVVIHAGEKSVDCNYCADKQLFHELIKKEEIEIEIIEVKRKLNRNVIGQILVADFMFKKKFNVKKVKKSVLYHIGDEALELFCNENHINLIKY